MDQSRKHDLRDIAAHMDELAEALHTGGPLPPPLDECSHEGWREPETIASIERFLGIGAAS